MLARSENKAQGGPMPSSKKERGIFIDSCVPLGHGGRKNLWSLPFRGKTYIQLSKENTRGGDPLGCLSKPEKTESKRLASRVFTGSTVEGR